MYERKKQNPDYDKKKVFREYMDEVVKFYQNSSGTVSLRDVASEFDTTLLKVRKVLITAGVFQTETSALVNRLYGEGASIEEIMSLMNLGRASVHSYLPYTKGIYNAKESSANAERLRVFRMRQNAAKRFCEALQNDTLDENLIWRTLEVFADYPFHTMKGMKFSYSIKGFEMFIDRKEKPITKSTVILFVDRVREIQSLGQTIKGPKQIGTFGASYLFSIFQRIGLFRQNEESYHTY